MVRQSMFKTDGSITDIPARDTEKPQLEKQPDLFQWKKDIDNLERLVKEVHA